MHNAGKGPEPSKGGRDTSWGAKYMGAGLQFGAAIVLFALAGLWLDRKLGTSPIFTIIGSFVGFGGGFLSLYSRIMADVNREESDAAAKQKGDRQK